MNLENEAKSDSSNDDWRWIDVFSVPKDKTSKEEVIKEKKEDLFSSNYDGQGGKIPCIFSC